jgi:hypothetical protein
VLFPIHDFALPPCRNSWWLYLISTDWTTGFWSPAEAKHFPLTSVFRPTLRPTQFPIQWVPVVLSRDKARPGRDADHSPHLVPRPRMRSYFLFLLAPTWRMGTALLYFYKGCTMVTHTIPTFSKVGQSLSARFMYPLEWYDRRIFATRISVYLNTELENRWKNPTSCG